MAYYFWDVTRDWNHDFPPCGDVTKARDKKQRNRPLPFVLFKLLNRPLLWDDSLRTADAFPVIAPKNSFGEPERQNDFRDVFPFVLMLANQIKGQNTGRVTPCDLARWSVLDFGERPTALWNVNFTTITRFPATLNADVFMKKLLLKLCM